jgi:hypothetical protein
MGTNDSCKVSATVARKIRPLHHSYARAALGVSFGYAIAPYRIATVERCHDRTAKNRRRAHPKFSARLTA